MIKDTDLYTLLDEITGATGEPTLADLWYRTLSDEIDPDRDGAVKNYENDPVGFCKEVLGIQNLTNDQEILLRAIAEYEIVMVKSATGVGKSYILAAAAIWFYKTGQSQVYMTAAPPERNLKNVLWAELMRFVLNNPGLFTAEKQSGLHIGRDSKNFITGVTIPASAQDEIVEARFSGKHHDRLIFLVDEGDGVIDPVYRGIEGCMSGGHARLVVPLNPRRKEGYPYRMISENKAHVITMSAFNHPNVRTGKNLIPGAVTRDVVIRRINEWSDPLALSETPDSRCFEVPDFLVGVQAKAPNGDLFPPLEPGWRLITDAQFFYKILGEYPTAGANALFPEEKINAARSRYDLYVAQHGVTPPSDVRPTCGLDVSDTGDDNNVFTARYGYFVAPQVVWGGIDVHATGGRAASEYKRVNAAICRVDSIGVGAGVAPHMFSLNCPGAIGVRANDSVNMRVEEGEFQYYRDCAYWLLRIWLLSEHAMLPPGRLADQMRVADYDVPNGRIKVTPKKRLKEILGYSPDEMDSLAYTFYPTTSWFGEI